MYVQPLIINLSELLNVLDDFFMSWSGIFKKSKEQNILMISDTFIKKRIKNLVLKLYFSLLRKIEERSFTFYVLFFWIQWTSFKLQLTLLSIQIIVQVYRVLIEYTILFNWWLNYNILLNMQTFKIVKLYT